MPTTAESPGKRSLIDHLRDAHLKGVSGALVYEVRGRSRRIYMRSGAIILSPESALASEVQEVVVADEEGRWESVLARLADHYLSEGVPQFVEIRQLERLPDGAAGPVPTAALLRRAFALLAPTEAAGDAALIADSVGTGSQRESPLWCPEESWVLERLREVMTYADLERQCPFPAQRLRGVVAGLRALGLVRSPDQASSFHNDSGLLKLTELLRTRIAASLRDKPLGLLDDALQRRLESLLERRVSATHYELLGVSPDAEGAQIQLSFEELARQVHPSHAERPGVHVSRVELAGLFDRAVAAMRTLGDPVLRAEYDSIHAIARGADVQSSSDRHAELSDLAQKDFERARFEELNGDLHTALVLYEQAATLAPQAEYLLALARLQAKNPAWSGRALESYRRALELRAPNIGAIRFEMGRVLERAGSLEEAISYYQAAADGDPAHDGAARALKRLSAAGHGRATDQGRGLGRFFRR